MIRFGGKIAGMFVPVVSTSIFYAAFQVIGTWAFGVGIKASAMPFDFALQLVIGCLLYVFSRRVWLFLVLQCLLIGTLYIGNAVKISHFGGPIVPDDVYAVRSLFLILDGWQRLALAVPLAAIVVLLLSNLTLRRRGSRSAIVLVAATSVGLAYQPSVVVAAMDRYFGNVVWSQHLNYLSRGAGIYLLQEGARFLASAEEPPEREDVLTAANSLLTNRERTDAGTGRMSRDGQRNVHMILLETFWDPSPLKAARFSNDPLVPEFRELWAAAGDSAIVSPVFGGYTANAEFEALCGFPVEDDSVKFERKLRNDVPCLPRILREQGYTTIASHPNVPVFWNRINAYHRLGFDTFWSKDAFKLDDMNRRYLSDASLYRQVLSKLSARPDADQPLFDYIVTIFGHWDYPLNDARPAVIESESAVPDVGAYANTVWYKSREFMHLISELRRQDPDALIVAFGDHLPMLGVNFAGYVESGLLSTSKSDFTPVMHQFSRTTPLLIIDGRRGPLDVGTIPLYMLPATILRLLGYHGPTILDLATLPPQEFQVRPLPGLHLNLAPDRGVEQCVAPYASPTCSETGYWLEQLRIVAADLFVGNQYLLQ